LAIIQIKVIITIIVIAIIIVNIIANIIANIIVRMANKRKLLESIHIFKQIYNNN
jgi:hypothetical protein